METFGVIDLNFKVNMLYIFYALDGTLGGILKSHCLSSVHPCVTNFVSSITQILLKANLMKFHKKIKHTEKVCCAQDLGSYIQGQGHS